jgi:outer membrane protein OmpA-like peptidoglycan-associated protein
VLRSTAFDLACSSGFSERCTLVVNLRASSIASVAVWGLALIISSALANPSAVSAQPSAAINRHVPAAHPRDGFSLRRGEVGAHLGWSASLQLDYSNDALVYESNVGDSDSEGVALVSDQLTSHGMGTLGLFEIIELAIDVPIHLVMDGEELGEQPTATGFGAGDLRVAAMFAVHRSELASVGLSTAITLGTGERGDGRPGVAGDSGATFAPAVHAAIHAGPLSILAEAGARWRSDAEFAGIRFRDVLLFGLGLEARIVPELLRAYLEGHGESPLDDVGDRATTPIGALLGAKLSLPIGLTVGAAGGMGITRGYGSPDARVLLSLAYARGGDERAEPELRPEPEPQPEPEPTTPAEKLDGQPKEMELSVDEVSRDGDGDAIADLEDSCPEVPGSPESSGCATMLTYDAETGALALLRPVSFSGSDVQPSKSPVLDEVIAFLRANPKKRVRVESHTLKPRRDNDSAIGRSVERARSLAEYLLAQGIPAKQLEAMGCGDRRPIAPERGSQRFKNERIELWVIEPLPKSGFRSTFGCVAHTLPGQEAPAKPAPTPAPAPVPAPPPVFTPAPVPAPPPKPTAPAVPPAAQLAVAGQIEIAPPIRFEEGRAEIKGKAGPALDELASKLKADPKMKVAVVSHTAGETDAASTLALSQKRAALIARELGKRGAKPGQVRALGCGQTRPVAPDNVPWGRKKNDRLEVLVLDPAANAGIQSLEGCMASEGP